MFAVSAADALAQPTSRSRVTGSNIKRIEGEGALPVQVDQRARRSTDERRAERDGDHEPDLRQQQRRQRVARQRHRLDDVQQPDRIAAGPGRAVPRWCSSTASALGTFGGEINGVGRREPRRRSRSRDRARRGAEGRRVGGVRQRRDRRRHQLHHAPGLSRAPKPRYGTATPTRSGGGDQYNFKATAGYGDLAKDRYNVFLSAYYDQQKNLAAEPTATSRRHSYIPAINLNTTSGNTFPATSRSPPAGIGSSGLVPDLPEPDSSRRPLPLRSFAATQGARRFPTPSSSTSSARARYQINSDWQAYLIGSYRKQESDYVHPARPLSDQFHDAARQSDRRAYPLNTILLPPTSPYYPHAEAAAAGRRRPAAQRALPRRRKRQSRHDGHERAVECRRAGRRARAWNWDWDGSFNYGQNTTKRAAERRLPAAFARSCRCSTAVSSTCSAPNTPADNAAGPGDELQRARRSTGKLSGYGIDIKGSSDVYKLPGRPARRSRSASRRGKETLTQDPNPILADGRHFGLSAATCSRSITRAPSGRSSAS